MHYLYHRVPSNMQGGILYPLNTLKELFPEAYAEQVKKYVGREEVMDQTVPTLDCKWNDVLHLSAVHPQQVADTFTKHNQEFRGRRFFQIDPHLLERNKTMVYLYRHQTPETKFAADNWERYDPDDIEKYSQLPEETEEYYRETFAAGGAPLLWHRVPHILYKGTIDTSAQQMIEI